MFSPSRRAYPAASPDARGEVADGDRGGNSLAGIFHRTFVERGPALLVGVGGVDSAVRE